MLPTFLSESINKRLIQGILLIFTNQKYEKKRGKYPILGFDIKNIANNEIDGNFNCNL